MNKLANFTHIEELYINFQRNSQKLTKSNLTLDNEGRRGLSSSPPNVEAALDLWKDDL